MKLELSIDVDYLPTWGVWEGIRELVQNSRDAEIEHGAKMTVRFDKKSGKLRIENEGVTLPQEVLLLGRTSKANRTDTIGRFGEGLKLGILALLRKGARITIRTGSEVWVPTIARSEKFKADVLVFTITGGREFKRRISIEVAGCNEGHWTFVQNHIRFLWPDPDKNTVNVPGRGSILLDPTRKGDVFVKGLYTHSRSDLHCGYDLEHAELDRDRRMVDSWDLRFRLQALWASAVEANPKLVERYFELLQKDAEDVRGSEHWEPSKAASEALAGAFKKVHGDAAVPVTTLADSRDLAHLGRVGAVVPRAMAAVLAPALGTLDKIKTAAANEIVATHGWNDLDVDERQRLEAAARFVVVAFPRTFALDDLDVMSNPDATPTERSDAIDRVLERLDVVTFRAASRLGQHDGATRRVALARGELISVETATATLLHEFAHDVAGDGDHAHVATLEEAWTRVLRFLLTTGR